MPGFDGTGPRGGGPMTGGGRGFCNPAFSRYAPGLGRGFGRGFGAGLGFRRGYGRGYGGQAPAPMWGRGYADPYYASGPGSDAQELDMLRSEAEAIRRTLDEINSRIERLEKNPSE